MKRSYFGVRYLQFRLFVTKLLSFYIFIISAVIAFFIIILDKLNIAFQDLTLAATAAIVAELLIYLAVERASILDDIRDRIRVSQAQFYSTRDETYMATILAMAEGSACRLGNRKIYHAVLHGYRSSRLKDSSSHPVLQLFNQMLIKRINSRGPDAWTTRQIYNITSEERLDMIIGYLNETNEAENYEARAFSLPDELPHLSPLIIGDKDVFLALDDPRFYRVSKAIHLQGQDYVNMLTEYLDTLWNDPRAIEIRSAIGINNEEVNRLRNILRNKTGVRSGIN